MIVAVPQDWTELLYSTAGNFNTVSSSLAVLVYLRNQFASLEYTRRASSRSVPLLSFTRADRLFPRRILWENVSPRDNLARRSRGTVCTEI